MKIAFCISLIFIDIFTPTFCTVLFRKLYTIKFLLVKVGRLKSILTVFCDHVRHRQMVLISVSGN